MTTTDELEVPEEVQSSLAAEVAELRVAPAALGSIRQRARQRQRRRRTALVAGGAAAALLVGVAVAGAVADGGSESVQTADSSPYDGLVGSGPQPLLVPGLQTGQQREQAGLEVFDGLSQLDELSATGDRSPWWWRVEGSDWSVQPGVELVDGRRVGLALGAMGSPLDGRLAIAEISSDGRTIEQHELALPTPPSGQTGGARIVGASGAEVFLGWTTSDTITGDEPAGVPIEDHSRTTVFAYDLRNGALREVLAQDDLGRVAVAGDVLVELDADGCGLHVHADLGAGAVRDLDGPCLSGRMSMLTLEALSPDGRYLAVGRIALTSGLPDHALVVVDLQAPGDGSLLSSVVYSVESAAPGPYTDVAWTGPRTLSVGIVTDDPQYEQVALPAAEAPLEVVAVPYRQRS